MMLRLIFVTKRPFYVSHFLCMQESVQERCFALKLHPEKCKKVNIKHTKHIVIIVYDVENRITGKNVTVITSSQSARDSLVCSNISPSPIPSLPPQPFPIDFRP